MATAVVCDDDGVLRSAVTAICEAAGLQVVAETDTGASALELIGRFGVDILVLDQSLPDMSGERVLEILAEEPQRPDVVVFSAYATEPDRLLALGAVAVVDKPDFAGLEGALLATVAARHDAAARAASDRRTVRRNVTPAPDLPRSADGIVGADELFSTAAHTVVGDSVLLVVPAVVEDGDRTGQLVRATVRIQDIVHRLPHVDGYVAVLRGGDEGAATAVWRRLSAMAQEAGDVGQLRGGWRPIDELGLMSAVERAEDALIDAPHGEPGLTRV